MKSQKLTTKASKLIKTFTIEIDDIKTNGEQVNKAFELGEEKDDVYKNRDEEENVVFLVERNVETLDQNNTVRRRAIVSENRPV